MLVHTLNALKDNFIYVLEWPSGACAAVDPGDAKPVLQFLSAARADARKRHLTHILCTHHHLDHVGGVEELKRVTNCEVLASAYDQTRIPMVTRALHDSEVFSVHGSHVTVMDMRGHTLGQIAYYFADHASVFVGDTLFSGGCGRLFEGTHEQMHLTLNRLAALPKNTALFFGHEYTLRNLEFVAQHMNGINTTDLSAYKMQCQQRLAQGAPTTPSSIGQELKINPFLRARDVEEFRRLREARNHF